MNPTNLRSMVPLAPFTSLGIGGCAQYLAHPQTIDSLRECLTWSSAQQLPRWILGGGSNVVIADQGLPGLVIRWIGQEMTVVREHSDCIEICVSGGQDWDTWVAWAVSQNLAGIECLSGIPGTVGAAPIQNIGAYGQELQESFVSATLLHLDTLRIETWNRERCQFGYRTSALKQAKDQAYLVLDVTFRLQKHGIPAVRYAELEQALSQQSHAPITLETVRKTILFLRRKKSMILDPQDPNSRSAGSFFMNPVVTTEQATFVRDKYTQATNASVKMPEYPTTTPGLVKLAAAWLIERSGFVKGQSWGTVGISEHHALALVNRGGATARHLLAVACHVQKRVLKQTGILLHPEPVLLGFPHTDLAHFEDPEWKVES